MRSWSLVENICITLFELLNDDEEEIPLRSLLDERNDDRYEERINNVSKQRRQEKDHIYRLIFSELGM